MRGIPLRDQTLGTERFAGRKRHGIFTLRGRTRRRLTPPVAFDRIAAVREHHALAFCRSAVITSNPHLVSREPIVIGKFIRRAVSQALAFQALIVWYCLSWGGSVSVS